MEPVLHVQDLSIRLGQFALHDLCCDADQGDYFCVIGPTGAGKTILLECIAGLHQPSHGSIRIRGRRIDNLHPEEREIGYVPQDYALFPHMNVHDNIAYGLVEHGMPPRDRREKIQHIADLLEIPHLLERRVTTLSGGEQQRVALARVLVLGRRLLLLDEPLGALDWVTKQNVAGYLRALHQQLGLTVLHVTHDFSEALDLANKVGVIREGRLIQTGTPEDVFTKPRNRTVASFVGMPNIWPARKEQSAGACELLQRLRESLRTDDGSSRWLCVRPDHVAMAKQALNGGVLSCEGTVDAVHWRRASYDIVVDVGRPLVVSLGTRHYRDLQVKVGDRVHIGVDPEHVHLVEDG